MTSVAVDDESLAPLGAFELVGTTEGDSPALAALRAVGAWVEGPEGAVEVDALARLAETWAAAGCVGLERDALASLVARAPTDERRQRLVARLVQTGRWAEAARTEEELADSGQAPPWRRWLAAGSPDDARRVAAKAEASRVALALQARDDDAEETLAAAAETARRGGDVEGWRSLAVDAWVESRGERGGPRLFDALRAAGRERAAMLVALDESAQALSRGGDAVGALLRGAALVESDGEALAVWSVRALMPGSDSAAARETLRDLLAERGRSAELAVRLRIDAWSAPAAARAAAWKGVAAMELPHDPMLASRALVEGLRAAPDDVEALDLLRTLAAEASIEAAVRDALWSLTRATELSAAQRSEMLLWLGSLEERAGDLVAAEAAYARVEDPVPQAFEGLARVSAGAALQLAACESAFAAAVSTDEENRAAAITLAVTRCESTPGAVAVVALAMETLAGVALGDEAAATLWLRAARRAVERGALAGVLRALATRSTLATVRAQGLRECLTLAEFAARDGAEAAELLRRYDEDFPGDATVAAALAALAERRDGTALREVALRAVAGASPDAAERDVLLRFAGVSQGAFEPLGAVSEEPSASAERSDRLRRLHDLLGDSVTLLALRTRALMAAPGGADEALAVARRFVELAPWSPEAVFAYAGLARLSDDPADIVTSIRAAVGSCARLPELASLTRGALTRLSALGADGAVSEVLDVAAQAGLLADRGLAEVALARTDAVDARAIAHLEIVVASSDTPDAAWVERLDALRRERGDAVGVLGARLRVPGGERMAVAEELDALAEGASGDDAQGRWVRCAVAVGHPAVALRWLTRWADGLGVGVDAGLRLRCAARVAWTAQRDAAVALAFLRDAVLADADAHEVLQDADVIGLGAQAIEPLLGIYDDAMARAAGEHGRRAFAYRRATVLERAGRTVDALAAQIELFNEARTIGASLRSIERLAGATGQWEPMLEAFEVLAAEAPSTEARVQFLIRCAEVARLQMRSAVRALGFEVQAWQVSRSRALWDRVIDRARALRPTHPDEARAAVHALIDGELASAQQAWDDSVRALHSLQALDCALTEAHDAERAHAAIGLYVKQHEAPRAARATVLEMIGRPGVPPELRDALLASPTLASVPPPAEPAVDVTTQPPRFGTLELVMDDDEEPAPRPSRRSVAPRAPSKPAPEQHEWISFVAEPRPVTPVPKAMPSLPTADAMPTVIPTGDLDEIEVDEIEPDPASFVITSLAPGAARRPTPTPDPRVTDAPPAESLRDAATRGNDAAAALLAERLAAEPDNTHEALAIQRARFDADPTRFDALDAIIELVKRGDRRGEALGLSQVRAVLRGEPSELRPLHPVELEDPPDGVARVLLPARLGPFAELGALLWESVGVTWRKELLRAAGRDEGVRVPPNSSVVRPFQAALRLLQMPRTTVLALRDGPVGSASVSAAASPIALVMSLEQAADTPSGHFAMGHLVEAGRTGHLPITAVAPDVADRMVRALLFAFGAPSSDKVDPAVAATAAQLMDATPTRLHRQVRAYVEELGPSLTPARWRAVIDQARARAGLLVSGDFLESTRWLLSSAPPEVPRSLPWAFVEWEPLRDLLRFAVSEEYLLLRWPNTDGRRRRVSSRPAPPTESR